MQDYEQASLERLQAATAGIDLTSGEQKTLKWISGWETSTVDNVSCDKISSIKSPNLKRVSQINFSLHLVFSNE